MVASYDFQSGNGDWRRPYYYSSWGPQGFLQCSETIGLVIVSASCSNNLPSFLFRYHAKGEKQKLSKVCWQAVFSERCNIYISHLCYDISVRLSVTEVHWHIIANLGLKFRSHFTAHCGRRAARRAA